MALIKVSKLDKTEIVGEFKHVQCRTATWVEDDGVIVGGKQFHRHVVSPGDDTTGETAETIAICKAVHTPELVEAYKAQFADEVIEDITTFETLVDENGNEYQSEIMPVVPDEPST